MKTLEELLQELGCEGNAFDSTGEFTKAGEKAYDRLEHLLYDIERLTAVSYTHLDVYKRQRTTRQSLYVGG